MSKQTKTVKDSKAKAKKNLRSKKKKKKAEKVSYHRRPEEMDIETWQYKLRWQFGTEADFSVENKGDHPFFSDFNVKNKESGQIYNVSIRMPEEGGHTCSCMDFKTNRLGVCKHIAFAYTNLEKKRGNKTIIKKGHRQPQTSIYLDYKNGRRIKISIGTENAAAFEKIATKYFQKDGTILPASYPVFEKIISAARVIDPDFRLHQDALEFVLHRREDLVRKAALDTFGELPADFVGVSLYPYQKEGVRFAVQAGRSLLADEMGLGKTVQAVAAAKLFKQLFDIDKVLIVCPTSLKYQWQAEIEKLMPEASTGVIEGGPIARRKFYRENEAFFTITGYHTVSNDLDHFNEQHFDLIILDEAQRIKNWKTKTSTKVKQLQSPYALVLTGTPIENKLEELYSIMQFIDQFRLPPLYAFLYEYQLSDPESGKVMGYQNLNQIKEILADVLLRRTRKQVLLQLPGRSDKTLMVPMTKEQMDIHNDYKDMVARIVHKWRKMGFLKEPDRLRLLTGLNSMRMVCDSTFILDQKTRHDTKINELMAILEEYLANEDHEKVVVFSQWQRMLSLVAEELDSREVGYRFLHGSVPSKKRGELFSAFKNDPECLIFLSTDAGGVGLNLQTASLIINLDVPWNPAVLEQRIARVYRMGQKRRVQVINLVASGTIEHDMLRVLQFKAGMAEGVLDDGNDMVFAHESRFSKFMGTIEDLTDNGTAATDKSDQESTPEESPNVQEEIKGEIQDFEAEAVPEQSASTQASAPFLEDEPGQQKSTGGNSMPQKHAAESTQGKADISPQAQTPLDLVQTGLRFMSGLAQTLSNPTATQKLVESITEKDEKSGQTYLRIPVESSKAVEDILGMLGGLFKGQ